MGDELFTLFAKLTLDTSEFDKSIDGSKEKSSGFGKGLASAAKVGVAAIATVGTAVVGAGTAIMSATSQVAEYGDSIDKMSQKMGMSAQAYQEWDAVMQHSGTSMETMKASMKTLASAAETGSDAFEKLGISQEELSSLSQEQLFERTISALQNVEDETTRTYLAGKTLGRGATELGALLNTSAEDTQAMRDRVRELGGVMSDDAVKAAAAYQDSLQDMTTAIAGAKRGIMSDFLPSMTAMMDGITNIFGGDSDKGIEQLKDGIESFFDSVDDAIPRAIDFGGNIIDAIAQAVDEHLPEIMDKGTGLVTELISGAIEGMPTALEKIGELVTLFGESILTYAPQLMDAGIQIITQISQGLVAGVPKLISNALPMILSFSETIRSGAGSLVDAGIDLVLNLAQGLMDSLPTLLEQVPQIVINIAGVINDNAPKLLVAGVKLLVTIGKGLIDAIPAFLENLPQIFEAFIAVWSAFNWINLGKSVITAIKNGFNALRNNLPSTLKSIGQSAKDWFTGIDWANAGKEIIGFIESAIRGLFTTIPGVLLEIANSAWDEFTSVDWYSVGSNVIEGIVNGLSAGIGWLKEKAAEAANSALQKAKDILGIKSPSRVFRDQVGKQIPRGMALGIEDTQFEVDKAIDRLNKDMLLGINRDIDYSPRYDFVSKGAKAAEGKVVNVTINSTVDGAQKPEEYAYALIQALQMELRTA